MAKLTSTPCGPIRLRDIKLRISGANSSGTSSCKTLNIKDCIVSFTFEKNEELSENSKNALLNTINIYLYSMPSVSYNNHLIFSLHLTNCESSVLDKINKQDTAHVNGKFTRETLIKSSHLCQTWWHWSQIVQSLVFKLSFVNKGYVRCVCVCVCMKCEIWFHTVSCQHNKSRKTIWYLQKCSIITQPDLIKQCFHNILLR